MAASGLGKALWHPMATVQNLDPRKNRLPKNALPRDPGAGGRGGDEGHRRLPAPRLAPRPPRDPFECRLPSLGMTFSALGNMRNIGKPLNPASFRPSVRPRASDEVGGRARWVRLALPLSVSPLATTIVY